MACDTVSLVNAAATGGFSALSQRDLKIATLYALCSLPGVVTSAATLLAGGIAQGYDKLSNRALDECILAAVCTIT